jgi:hypothetical protein
LFPQLLLSSHLFPSHLQSGLFIPFFNYVEKQVRVEKEKKRNEKSEVSTIGESATGEGDFPRGGEEEMSGEEMKIEPP